MNMLNILCSFPHFIESSKVIQCIWSRPVSVHPDIFITFLFKITGTSKLFIQPAHRALYRALQTPVMSVSDITKKMYFIRFKKECNRKGMNRCIAPTTVKKLRIRNKNITPPL